MISDSLRDLHFLRVWRLQRSGEAAGDSTTATRCSGANIFVLARARRYALQGTRWRVRDLWWRVSLYPDAPDLPRDAVDAALRRAFQLWASAADLRFHQAEAAGEAAGRRVHIDVRWERGAHGDWDDFDGRGGVLAHANYPSFGGAVHLDADERWALDDAPPPAHDAPGVWVLGAAQLPYGGRRARAVNSVNSGMLLLSVTCRANMTREQVVKSEAFSFDFMLSGRLIDICLGLRLMFV
ncbi:Matrix metalloproteinase 1 isoform 2 [Gryllus bimaculatus]|nr:Matrix metalloproteinase 1 isoform 2 [Gryllus bimaculatus]